MLDTYYKHNLESNSITIKDRKYKTFCNYIPNLVLETSAGEKNEILSKLPDFLDFIKIIQVDKYRKKRFSYCIDTCHIF